jgi:hypothetical protein
MKQLIIPKSGQVLQLLFQTNERIDLINLVTKDFQNIEGVNVINIWKELYEAIQEIWKEKSPLIVLNETKQNQLAFILDIVAMFFLYNGSEKDDKFLSNVGKFFEDMNIEASSVELTKRFEKIK